ncbi:MAG: hypothetical protein B7Z72_15150, partial [Gemmatimonadetes bacterium 21-71-4]
NTRDRIVHAACDALTDVGVGGVTVAFVARRARVSSALVHYHFATKQRLLVEAALTLARRRADSRVAALETGSGLAGLDAVWTALVAGTGAPAERAWPDLVLVSRGDAAVRVALGVERDRERSRMGGPLARLLESLGSRPHLPAEDLAAVVGTFLDGASASLASGVSPDDVRASYDAFWLALVALGQAAVTPARAGAPGPRTRPRPAPDPPGGSPRSGPGAGAGAPARPGSPARPRRRARPPSAATAHRGARVCGAADARGGGARHRS